MPIIDPYFIPVIVAGVVGGGSTGLLGVYVVGMRIPLIGVAMAHAAMAGSIFAYLLGWPQTIVGLASATLAAFVVSLITQERSRISTDVALGVVFSLTMGLAFLGIGLVPGPKTEALRLIWGSILFVDWRDVLVITVTAVILIVFLSLFSKEMKSILFSRVLAKASGVHEGFVWMLFLAICGATLTVNLNIVGGLMIYSLMVSPAAAALQVCRSYSSALVTAVCLGSLSALGGFIAAYLFDLPTGACIVLFSSLLFAAAVACRQLLQKREQSDPGPASRRVLPS
jgi:manganese/iron transport system permease protein